MILVCLPTLDPRNRVFSVSAVEKSRLEKLEEKERGSGYLGERIVAGIDKHYFAEITLYSKAYYLNKQ